MKYNTPEKRDWLVMEVMESLKSRGYTPAERMRYLNQVK